MGIFDDIKNHADANEAQVEGGIDQAGDLIDSRTGGQHAAHVDQAQDFLKDRIGAPSEAPADAPVDAPVEPSPSPEEPA